MVAAEVAADGGCAAVRLCGCAVRTGSAGPRAAPQQGLAPRLEGPRSAPRPVRLCGAHRLSRASRRGLKGLAPRLQQILQQILISIGGRRLSGAPRLSRASRRASAGPRAAPQQGLAPRLSRTSRRASAGPRAAPQQGLAPRLEDAAVFDQTSGCREPADGPAAGRRPGDGSRPQAGRWQRPLAGWRW
jgi:hypothetical protein